jgi:hypothetical protein
MSQDRTPGGRKCVSLETFFQEETSGGGIRFLGSYRYLCTGIYELQSINYRYRYRIFGYFCWENTEKCSHTDHRQTVPVVQPVFRIRILDPVLFYPPHPGSGMLLSRIPDPTYFCIKAINKIC